MIETRIRFTELKARGIVKNWPTLRNRINKQGFPPGKLTGPNERTWTEQEVKDWIDSRPTAPKPTPRSPGKPRATTPEAA